MSVQRSFAQRNTNNTQIVPVRYVYDLSSGAFANFTNAATYILNISNAHYVGGIYYVDLADVDSSGNPLNFNGIFNTSEGQSLPIICFAINIETTPATYPGLKVPIFFKNMPFGIYSADLPLPTIGIVDYSLIDGEFIPLPFILSPPFPQFVGQNISPNITLKSDTDNFEVVSSGPAGWLGIPALASILAVYTSIL